MQKLNIVVPVFNAEKTLKTCMDSLIHQTYKNKMIILVDDGSSDSSSKMCDQYTKRYDFVQVIHKSNGGVSSARNAALDRIGGGTWYS